jgi:hypothetical protein
VATFGYLTLWLIALILAFLIGLGTHYWHSFLQPYPDKLIEGYRWRDHALNGMLNNNYSWWNHYDEDGWWEFYSLRNYATHATAPVALVLILGATLWSTRADRVASFCASVAKAGIKPLFCS